jgi:RNA polymerase sigma-70 factor (family 1)
MTKYKHLEDVELVALLRDGDKIAYTEIYKRYFNVLFVHAYKKLNDDEETRDLIQELFTNLWIRREVFVLNSSLIAYLFTVVRNRVLDHHAHKNVKSRYISSLQQFIDIETVETDHRVREKELLDSIEKEIQALPRKMREVFELSRRSHFTHKEISEQLKISEQTVAKQVSNALRTLRCRFGEMLLILFLMYFK